MFIFSLRHHHKQSAFTLIELSVVLVIIGLIIGAVLVGRDLIESAKVRSQIAQIEAYKTAVNSFRLKYGQLPGDLDSSTASSLGFASRNGSYYGGNNDGIIRGHTGWGWAPSTGETGIFWRDLSDAGMIEGKFSTAAVTVPASDVDASTTPSLNDYFPTAKIGNGNYVYVWSQYPTTGFSSMSFVVTSTGNYFGLSQVSQIVASPHGKISSNKGLSVQQAYMIDSKMDDGAPQNGSVFAAHVNTDPRWMDNTNILYNDPNLTGAITASSTTCYDNNAVSGVAHSYSLSQNNGDGVNCALSFRMQ